MGINIRQFDRYLMKLREDNNTISIEVKDGQIESATLCNNAMQEANRIPVEQLPSYVRERVALLLLTDVNKGELIEGIGRRINNNHLTLRITYEEYKQLRSA